MEGTEVMPKRSSGEKIGNCLFPPSPSLSYPSPPHSLPLFPILPLLILSLSLSPFPFSLSLPPLLLSLSIHYPFPSFTWASYCHLPFVILYSVWMHLLQVSAP